MISPLGEHEDHWYYRSDQVIVTDEFFGDDSIPEFEGPISGLNDSARPFFGRNELAQEETTLARILADRGFPTYRAYLENLFSGSSH
jgi:hypothetical protein